MQIGKDLLLDRSGEVGGGDFPDEVWTRLIEKKAGIGRVSYFPLNAAIFYFLKESEGITQ